MPHAAFPQLILSDEVARREAGSIALRAKASTVVTSNRDASKALPLSHIHILN